jgi:hypothetical protein
MTTQKSGNKMFGNPDSEKRKKNLVVINKTFSESQKRKAKAIKQK